jgi:type VI secretion system protein ImpA
VHAPPDADGADGAAPVAAEAAGARAAAAEPPPADPAARAVAAAHALRQQDPTAPAPYLLLRGLRWGELRARRGVPDVRLLEAPATHVRARLKGLLLDGRWAELLEQSEQVLGTGAGRGWLDLQRYVLTACARLGPAYDGRGAGVSRRALSLLDAVPPCPRHAHGRHADREPETARLARPARAVGRRPAERRRVPPTGGRPSIARLPRRGAATPRARAGARPRARRRGFGAARPVRLGAGGARPRAAQQAIELLVAELERERRRRGASCADAGGAHQWSRPGSPRSPTRSSRR